MQCEACGHNNIDGARFCAGCGVLLPLDGTADDPLIGQTIGGRYRITGVLGEGGMGVVYVGEQQMGSTVRKVAVKTLHSHLSKDPSVLARFHRECGTVAQLEHPNTIKFYDFGATPDGTLYIAMEFVNGKALSDAIVESGVIAAERVLKIMRQVCGALDEAHEQGIVHRDLKPENIILTPLAGEADFVKVLDFGIAARSESADAKKEQKLTQQGMVLGTPPYMSPEQFTGKALDRRSDIYSLGVLAYEMLTGKLPFDADTPWQWATQHMTAQPTPFEASAPQATIPDAMRAAILRALSKDPSSRQPTAKDFFSELSSGAAVTAVEPASHGPASSATAAMGAVPDFSGPTPAVAPTMIGPMPEPAPHPGGYVPHAPAPVVAYATPLAQPARRGGGSRMLIFGLGAVGAVTVLVGGVVALIMLRPKADTSEPLVGPVTSGSVGAATIAPVLDQAPSATTSASTQAPETEKPPTTPVHRKDAGGPVTGDPCGQCVAQASAGNIPGAAALVSKCTDSTLKTHCVNQARANAPGAAKRAAFNGKCAEAKAIVSAANAMGAGSPALNGCLQGTKCQ
jgi:eukaryotic-like serine/threonine-protein kinase